jgi:hypothetical protein
LVKIEDFDNWCHVASELVNLVIDLAGRDEKYLCRDGISTRDDSLHWISDLNSNVCLFFDVSVSTFAFGTETSAPGPSTTSNHARAPCQALNSHSDTCDIVVTVSHPTHLVTYHHHHPVQPQCIANWPLHTLCTGTTEGREGEGGGKGEVRGGEREERKEERRKSRSPVSLSPHLPLLKWHVTINHMHK